MMLVCCPPNTLLAFHTSRQAFLFILSVCNVPVVAPEFFFPRDDNIVLVRCAARPLGKSDTPRVRLSFISGLTVSKNGAYEMLEDLRKALRWQAVPVLMGNDPKSNSDVKLPFEKLFEQYLPRAALKK